MRSIRYKLNEINPESLGDADSIGRIGYEEMVDLPQLTRPRLRRSDRTFLRLLIGSEIVVPGLNLTVPRVDR